VAFYKFAYLENSSRIKESLNKKDITQKGKTTKEEEMSGAREIVKRKKEMR